MEKEIVDEIGFIKEKVYQRVKNNINKKDDFYTQNELEQFTNTYKKSDVILT